MIWGKHGLSPFLWSFIMSYLLFFAMLFSTLSVSARTVNMRKIDSLMKRVTALERRVKSLESKLEKRKVKTSASHRGPKVKDMGNKPMGEDNSRFPASQFGAEGGTESQREEVMKQLKEFKEKFDERQKTLDKLLHEEP